MRAFVVAVEGAAAEPDAEIVSDVLFGLGAAAVEERRAPGDGIELWTHVGDGDDAVARAVAALPDGTRWRVVDVDETVADGWREHAEAIWVTDELLIAPAWKPLPAAPGALPPETLVLSIDPGAAFGFGDHPTTVLTLRALLERARRGPLGTVLDVGCGSGVLAVAAARLGAERVVAIDIADAAVVATRDNAERNGVADIVVASLDPLAAVDGVFDVVLANILAPTITELSEELIAAVATDGQLTISGILTGDGTRMAAVLQPLQLIATRHLNGWSAADFAAHSGGAVDVDRE